MPIAKITASEAINCVKSNPNGRWPKRGGPNRLAPMAKPHFTPGFTLPKGGTIFTIGSCFARNVESALKDRGFALPALSVIESDEGFKTIGTRVLNNYGAPSICNEIKWAFQDEIDEDACFYQTGNGWIDLHLNNTLRPTDLDTLRARRTALRAAYRSIAECDAVIITLGLSEVWYDTQTGYYLNMAPRRTMLREDPDRFELHVLSYGETIAFLQEAIALIREKGRDGVRVVLTVSPVPLTATYRDTDIMVANTYSKSVLRTAAEEVVQEHDFVDYFPSFESITLSDRNTAYKDDEIHVHQDIIDMNIDRMVTAYSGEKEKQTIEDVRANLATYRSRPKVGFDELAKNTDMCADPEIATVFTECALATGRLDVAEVVLSLADDPSGILHAQLLMLQDNPAGALSALNGRPTDGMQLTRYFGLRVRAFAKIARYEDAVDATEEWARDTPNSPVPYKVLAKMLADAGDYRAKEWFSRALEVSGGNTGIVLDMAEFLLRSGQADTARETLKSITRASEPENRRREKLLLAI